MIVQLALVQEFKPGDDCDAGLDPASSSSPFFGAKARENDTVCCLRLTCITETCRSRNLTGTAYVS